MPEHRAGVWTPSVLSPLSSDSCRGLPEPGMELSLETGVATRSHTHSLDVGGTGVGVCTHGFTSPHHRPPIVTPASCGAIQRHLLWQRPAAILRTPEMGVLGEPRGGEVQVAAVGQGQTGEEDAQVRHGFLIVVEAGR